MKTSVLIFVLSFVALASSEAVVSLDPSNFDKVIGGDHAPALVEFFCSLVWPLQELGT